ncbi:MarR family transcriptional regulator [Mycobacterium sp. smrl_JER01]
MVKGTSVPADAVVLSAEEASELSDRVYQVRCAAEDMATALAEGAGPEELRELCESVLQAARAADGWR